MCVCLRVSTCEIFHNEKPTRKNLIERTQTHTHAYDSFIMHACLCARMHVFVTTRTSTAEQRRWRRRWRRLRNFPSLCFMLALPAVLWLCLVSWRCVDVVATSRCRHLSFPSISNTSSNSNIATKSVSRAFVLALSLLSLDIAEWEFHIGERVRARKTAAYVFVCVCACV